MNTLELFPLQIVAYPLKKVPLHIFEERYKRLINTCIKADQPFGLVFRSKKSLAKFGCTLRVTEVLSRYPGGELDIMTQGETIFSIKSKTFHGNLMVGRVEFLEDIHDATRKEIEDVREKYLRLLVLNGVSEDIERHLKKHLSFELIEYIQLPDNLELMLISTQSEKIRLKIIIDVFDQMLDADSRLTNTKLFEA